MLRGLAGVPHAEVGDELVAAFEGLEQRDLAPFADQVGRGVDLDHGQPSAGGRDRIAFPGMSLLADEQLVELRRPADSSLREIRCRHRFAA
jgi:hypothetical protein